MATIFKNRMIDVWDRLGMGVIIPEKAKRCLKEENAAFFD